MVAVRMPATARAWALLDGPLVDGALVVLLATTLVLVATYLLAAIRGDGRRTRVAVIGLALVACIATAVVSAAADPGHELIVGLLSVNALAELEFALVVTAFLGTRSWWLVLATAPPYLAIRAMAMDELAWTTVEEWALASSGALALAIVIPYLRDSAGAGDQAAADARGVEARLAAREAQFVAADEAHRSVHDDLISALRALASRLPSATVRSACARALETVSGRFDLGSSSDLLRRLAAQTPVRLQVIDHGWPADLPPGVAHAFLRSATEALRNVERHSGVGEATVTALAEGRTAVLTVRDEGRGTDRVRPGFGLGESVIGRMEAIGGEASVVSARGRGMTVRLSWVAPDAPDAPDGSAWFERIPLGPVARRRVYLSVAGTFILCNTVAAGAHLGDHVGASIGVLVLCSLLLSAAGWKAGSGPMTIATTLGLGAAMVGITALGLSLTAPGDLLAYESWVVGYATITIAIIGFEAPVRAVAVLTVVQVAVIATFAGLDPTISLWDPVGAYTPVLLCGTFAAVIGGLLAASRAPLARHHDVVLSEQRYAAWAEVHARVQADRLTAVVERVRPLLEQGRTALGTTPELAAAAGRAEQQCRDDLHFETPLSVATHQHLDRLRDGGAVVSIRSGETRANPTGASRLIAIMADHGLGGSRVAIYLERGGSRVVVRPGLPAPQVQGLAAGFPELRIDADPARTQLVLPA